MKRIEVEIEPAKKNPNMESQIINFLKSKKKPILVSDLYVKFPNVSDRHIRTIIFRLTKIGVIDDSKKCECGQTRLVKLA
jgi:hypothetical protein